MQKKYIGMMLCITLSLLFVSCSKYIPVKDKTPTVSKNTSAPTSDYVHEGKAVPKLFPILDSKDKWGYIDDSGKVVVQPKYDMASYFFEGLAFVQTQDEYGFIDEEGNIAIKPEFTFVTSFSEGRASYFDDKSNTYGYIDKDGKIVIPAKYDFAGQFSEGLALVKLNEKYGYIDAEGKIVIEPKFEYAYDFSEGLAHVVVAENKSGYIDKEGKYVILPTLYGDPNGLEYVGDFSDGLAPAKESYEDKWGFIDKSGKFVLEKKYDYVGNFSEGLACVSINGLFGYIDKSGKMVIENKYEEAHDFLEGLAMVKSKTGFGYIDKNGKAATDFKFDRATDGVYISSVDFQGGVARVLESGIWGYINKDGKYIWNSGMTLNSEADENEGDSKVENQYAGTWLSKDFTKKLNDQGDEVSVGSILNVENVGDEGLKINIAHISSPPASKSAGIAPKILNFIESTKATFTFDDDGWGNKGKGSITFDTDKITVNIEITQQEEESRWSIFEGEKEFYRKELDVN